MGLSPTAVVHRLNRLPRGSVRLRLTLIYSGLFLASGATLLTITYLVVSRGSGSYTVSRSSNGMSVTVTSGGSPVQIAAGGVAGRLSPEQLQAQAEQFRTAAVRQHDAEMRSLLTGSVIALALMTGVSVGLGWVVAGRVLRPLRTITATARDISASNLNRRLAMTGPDDEVKELGDTFDGLLSRLEASFEAQRRFVANASHELRSPLARQRAVAQVALADPDATVESLRTAHERVLAAGAQQEHLIDALLALARGQAGVQRRELLDLAALTGHVLGARGAEAEQRGLAVRASLRPATLVGDPRLVERLVCNLADNAVRHNVNGGRVEVRTEARDGRAALTLANTAQVLPEASVERLFQPFQRLGVERIGHGEGVGLGLSIVRAIADAHGATATARALPDGGLQIEVCFPAPVQREV